MKSLLTLLTIALSFPSMAQEKAIKSDKDRFEDSIFNHYMKDGAWKTPIFSRKRERYIDSALAILPHVAYLWQQRGMPLLKQNKYELAMAYFDSAVKYDAKQWLDYRATMKCIFAKNYRGALADFDAARALNGNTSVMDHPYDFYSALCYLQLNQFDSAEIFLRKCINRTINDKSRGENWVHYVHWFYLGIARFEQEDYITAIEYLDRSMKDYPHFSDAGYYKAICLMRLKQPKEALPVIRQAKEDADKGYTLNEDQAYYETYPYQVKKYYLKGIVDWIEEENKTN